MNRSGRSTAWRILGGLILGAAVGAVIGLLIRGSEAGQAVQAFANLDLFQRLVLLIGSLATILAVLATHEAGHIWPGG